MTPVAAVVDTVRGWLAGLALARAIYAPPAAAAPARTPADLGLAFEPRTWLTSRDRLTVAAWWVPGSGPDAVVVSHGMGDSRDRVLEHVRMLHEAGFSVLAYDNRNHGASQASRRTWRMATRFTGDLLDAVSQVRREVAPGARVGVLAFSFSCWPALRAARVEGAAVDAVVCDSGPVVDIAAVVARLARLRAATLPERLRTGPGLRALQASARSWALTLLHQPDWPLTGDGPPVLFVTGARDGVLTSEEVLALAAVTPRSDTWVVPRAGHLRALAVAGPRYAHRVGGFLRTGAQPVDEVTSSGEAPVSGETPVPTGASTPGGPATERGVGHG
ncbi:MAG: alpha/beta hydrolase [Kineosporiaceae bacterium]